MGWASGSEILGEVWMVVRGFVPSDDRAETLADLMEVFAGHDCDTLNGLICKEFPEAEEAYKLLNDEGE